MKDKQYKQVHRAPGGYFFRVTLPVAKFQCDERWPDAADAAFFADLFKLYLVKRYKLVGNTMWPSLAPAVFAKMMGDIGADRNSLDDLKAALPHSCTEFLLNCGNELLTEYCENRSAMTRVIQ